MSAPLLPPALWEQLSAFLSAGNTGTVEISVRGGKITGYRLTASWQVPSPPEPEPRIVELTETARHRLQSRR